MRRLALPVLCCCLLLPLGAAAGTEQLRLGQPTSEPALVSIDQLLDNPSQWSDQRVRVAGLVSGVCPKKGCWMTLASERGAEVRVQFEDDVVAVPRTAEGHQAWADGIVRLRELTRDEWIAWRSHLAEERDETWDAATAGEGPFQMVSLEGLGVEISMPEEN